MDEYEIEDSQLCDVIKIICSLLGKCEVGKNVSKGRCIMVGTIIVWWSLIWTWWLHRRLLQLVNEVVMGVTFLLGCLSVGSSCRCGPCSLFQAIHHRFLVFSHSSLAICSVWTSVGTFCFIFYVYTSPTCQITNVCILNRCSHLQCKES